MKYVLIIFLLGSSLSLHASGMGSCSREIYESKSAKDAVLFLKRFEGKFRLGSCRVELHVCELDGKGENESGSMAADMLVTDQTRFSRYVPFFVTEEKTLWSKQMTAIYDRALVYRFNDHNFDPASGQDERFDIELVTKNEGRDLDYLEIGHSSEIERSMRLGKKWIVCGEEREGYIRNHPIKHKLESIWWWLTHKK